ncbi:MAG: type I DNA topoisomerase [Bacteroidia bacterium]|nr:type I DNA topoisomerase [Bacteroidia bacterium]MDW8088521.1 type I DNA topoisomerase [Bacteroidia bacterium]
MGKTLLIVESPTKAQTIRRLLGGDYEVVASQGHVRDLPKKGLSIKIERQAERYLFTPIYQVDPKKHQIIERIKALVAETSTVYLATDEDREGEAIAWHLCELLGLDLHAPIRIAFHEITQRALQEALKSPRPINLHLVQAQQARRLLDRLVGYEVSPILWRALPRRAVKSAHSAGRVQSVALRLVVERERAIASFVPEKSIEAEIELKATPPFRAFLEVPEFSDLETAHTALKALQGHFLRVKALQKKLRRRSPPPPFITSTLQQEAQRRLGFSIQRTMRIAQSLYEKGLISYMRTDSTYLSPEAREAIGAVIAAKFGAEAVVSRAWEEKKALHAQEAHEAIRPTDPNEVQAGDTPEEQKLYQLIWRRALASQMAEALYEDTVVDLVPEPSLTEPVLFRAKGRILLKPGFLQMYGYTAEDEEDAATLPPLKEGDRLAWQSLRLWEKFSAPPPRYTEASLVRELEARGIGRPSTYAPILETLFKRQYVRRASPRQPRPSYHEIYLTADGSTQKTYHTPPPEIQKNRLVPTPTGIQVIDFLLPRFPDILDYGFTARVEAELDRIAAESLNWQEMLNQFYVHFIQEIQRARTPELHQRLLGEDPHTHKPIYLRFGREKVFLTRSMPDEADYKEVSLPSIISPTELTLEQALWILSLPRQVGLHEGLPIELRLGPYGYYLHWAGRNYPLPSGTNPYTLTAEIASAAIRNYQTRRAASGPLRTFPELGIEVYNGRYGLYLRQGQLTRSLPKTLSLEELTPELCQQLLENAKAKRRSTPKA